MKLITSTQLQELFKRKSRRGQECLPELIRKLVRLSINATGNVCFPSGDAIYTPGWDGIVNGCSIEHEYVPLNNSLWELGTTSRTIHKIESDFHTRSTAITAYNKKSFTYVAVTPKIISQASKIKFCEEHRKENIWQDIRIYDANDLECWLEEHIDIAIWLLSEFGQTVSECNIITLSQAWANIIKTTTPSLTLGIITAGNEAKAEKLYDDVSHLSNNGIYTVVSPYGGREQAYYFTIASFMQSKDDSLIERCVIAKTQSDLNLLKAFCKDKIVLLPFNCLDENLGRDDANIYVFFYGENNSGLVLERTDERKFAKELERMGYDSSTAYNVASTVDCNISSLKRLLANNPNLRQPVWAKEKSKYELIPLMLMGELWLEKESYLEALKTIIGDDYDDYLDKLDFWTYYDDSPIFRFDNIFRLNNRKECFDFIGINYLSLKVKKIEQFLQEILASENRKYLKESKNWSINDGSFKWGRDLIHHIIDGLILLSMKSKKAQIHYDAFVKSVLEKATDNCILLRTLAPHFYKLAELSPQSYIEYVDTLIETDNDVFIKLLNDNVAHVANFHQYISSGLDVCLRMKETAVDALRIRLKLYCLCPSKSIFEDVVRDFSPVATFFIPVKLSDKMDLLYNFVGNLKDQNKMKEVVQSFIVSGKMDAMHAVYKSYKLPCKCTLGYTYDEYFDMQKRATYWMIDHGDITEDLSTIKEILQRMHTSPHSIIIADLEQLRDRLKNAQLSDEQKAQLNLLFLKKICDINRFEDWIEERKSISILESLCQCTTPQDEYLKWRYVFRSDDFPIVNPTLHKQNDSYELDMEKRAVIINNALDKLIDIYGDSILERIIDDASGRVYNLWQHIYTKSNNHIRDIRILLEKSDRIALTYYLGNSNIETIQVILKNTSDAAKELLCQCLPIREDVIDFLSGRQEEVYFWKNRQVWFNTVAFHDKAYRKLLQFSPCSLLYKFAYRDKEISYQEGIDILKAILNSGDIAECLGVGRSDHHIDALQSFVEIMDKSYYTEELAQYEAGLLPFIMGRFQADYPMGIKRFFWEHPEEFGRFICEIETHNNELNQGSYGQTILFNIVGGMGNNAYIPTEYMLQKRDELRGWVNKALNVGNGYDKKTQKILSMAVLSILALCPHGENEEVWPSKEVADIVESLQIYDEENSAHIASHFFCSFSNARGIRSVENGDYEHSLSAKYRAYSNKYRITHPTMAKALEYISKSFDQEGDNDKLYSLFGQH